jgi:16S rRNA (guanine527-N7)-methyltransferase
MTEGTLAARDLQLALGAGLKSLGMPLPEHSQSSLVAYVALLAKWNATYNLTAIRDPERMLTHHILDSLAVLPALDAQVAGVADVHVLDVGSGAGLPGLPIAIARPAWRITMLEPVQKRAAFVTQAIAEIGIPNAKILARRVEDYEAQSPVHIAISRAFSDLASFAESSARHVGTRGVLVAMKGVHPDEELRELPPAFEVRTEVALDVPGVDAARHLIVMQQRHDR